MLRRSLSCLHTAMNSSWDTHLFGDSDGDGDGDGDGKDFDDNRPIRILVHLCKQLLQQNDDYYLAPPPHQFHPHLPHSHHDFDRENQPELCQWCPPQCQASHTQHPPPLQS